MRSFFHFLYSRDDGRQAGTNLTRAAVLLISFIMMGCQTSRIRAWDDVKPGQTKTSVLESLGGPDRTIREVGLDRWIYVFYKKGDLDNPEWKELQFVNNKVTYIGDRIKPSLTPEQADEKNEESNRAEDQRLAKIQKANDRKLCRISGPAYSPLNNNDDQLVNVEAEKLKKAPIFEPVR